MEEEQQSEVTQSPAESTPQEQPPAVVPATAGEASLGQRIGAALIEKPGLEAFLSVRRENVQSRSKIRKFAPEGTK